jgi:ribosomal protein S18 acetylase RimI-like enzyme
MHHPLDDPIWSALTGPNANLGMRYGKAMHFQRDVAPFSAISEASNEAYADLAVQLPPGALVRMFRPSLEPLPSRWEHVEDFPLLQMVASRPVAQQAARSTAIFVLTAKDLPAILDLIATTQPGPFGEKTLELGLSVGIWEDGRLLAMAGERMRVPGYVELSAICTVPPARHRGLAAMLVQHLVERAFERRETPCLHVALANTAAVSLYGKLGFTLRKELRVLRRRPIRDTQ